ncbi:MAG: endonuclease/exonuclease/phosphatase family protein [Methylovulum sp.]|nr:endonuclease/exonuclease/phosphatase family protein [Methylovulum sp.]
MSRWLKRIGLVAVLLFAALMVLALSIRYQGIQYLAAYSGNGFAHGLPTVNDYPALNNNCTSEPINVLTYNVEYGSAFIESMAARFRNGNTGGALPWSVRLPEIRGRISGYLPDLIGLQETHTDADIAAIVPLARYTLVSYHLGNFNYGDAALLFKTNKFELLDNGQVWLGPNPKLPMSFGFKPLAMIRYVNWAMLREKNTGFTFMFVNTHFDNAGVNKEPSATLFRNQLAVLAKGIPMIVTGDFNTTATTERYRRFTGADENPPVLRNAYAPASDASVAAKFHPDQRIDHILVGGPCPVKTELWFIDPRPLKNGQPMSDHDPVFARLRFLP